MRRSSFWTAASFGVLITIFLGLGCSGAGSPVDPGSGARPVTPATAPVSGAQEILCGLYDITIDSSDGSVEIVPLRSVMFEVNATKFLQPPASPSNLIGITLAPGSDLPNGYVLADVGITHPFPNSNLMGFDVRGIFMPPSGGYTSAYDPTAIWRSYDQARLLNADGYTRRWNQAEFTSYNTIFGYTEGAMAPHGFASTCTLNPYKYFANGLGPTDPLNLGTLGMTNRGSFATTAPGNCTRRYEIQFPPLKGTDFRFKYAITASWAPPFPGTLPPAGYNDFGTTANQPEPVLVTVVDAGSTAYYTPTTTGGDLRFKITISDWQGGSGPDCVNGISSVIVESPTLFPGLFDPLNGGEWWFEPDSPAISMYCFIPNVTPTTVTGQEVLLTVLSWQPNSYFPEFPGYDYPPGAELAAYQVWTAPIQ